MPHDISTNIGALKTQFLSAKTALLENFSSNRPTVAAAAKLSTHLCRLVDHTLSQLWRMHVMPKGAALVAVGGYGRGELLPFSDIDVLVLLPIAPSVIGDESLAPTVSDFITACWDIGMDIGSSVRTVEECTEEAKNDITVQTSLLESRYLCGSRERHELLVDTMQTHMDIVAFSRAKILEMRQRHTRYEDTPYALEPNCKESPGGLRDLQVLMWLARAAGFGHTWKELAQKGLLTSFEARQLQANEGLLKLIRTQLHIVAKRREDRLVFDLQDTVAKTFGYENTPQLRASELLMQRYYWAAKAVTQLNEVLLLNMRERIHGSQEAHLNPIDEDFVQRNNLLEIRSDDLYQRKPQAILRTFILLQSREDLEGLSARTLRALYNARHIMNGAFRKDPINRAQFMTILTQPVGHTRIFRLLNKTSVLGRYLWVFRRIVGQMQHDLFHVYTVDQHILMVLRNVRRYFIPEHAHEYPFCTQLASQWDKPHLLYIAALFHDVAKGRGGDHSELGGIEVRRFCRDHGIPKEDAKLVEFLVNEHLTMSRVAQKEDLSDPDVIAAFAKRMGSARYLIGLYLLTVADIRGTSPKVWNAWKGKLLEDLLRMTLRALGGARPSVDTLVESRKQQAKQSLALRLMPKGIEEPLWSTLETSYFARHDADEIAWHVRCLQTHIDSNKPHVFARQSPLGEGLQVLVYAIDREALFANICRYFDQTDFNIQDARIHTTKNGHVLDTFQLISGTNSNHSGVAYRDLIGLIENQLAEALLTPVSWIDFKPGRSSRRVRSFPVPPRVRLKPDERAQRWLLSVSASDRSGLLLSIASVLARHQMAVHLAKIDTLGERVEDIFLITGPGLSQDKVQLKLETDLLDVLTV